MHPLLFVKLNALGVFSGGAFTFSIFSQKSLISNQGLLALSIRLALFPSADMQNQLHSQYFVVFSKTW